MSEKQPRKRNNGGPDRFKERRECFCQEYLKDLNGTRAAIRAGCPSRGARKTAQRWLTRADVAARINALKANRAEEAKIKASNVLEELACMAFYDPADIGNCKITCPADIAQLPEKIRRAIIGWSWDRNQNFTLKLAPKTPNLELIGRHLGMFVDRVKHEGDRLVLVLEDGPAPGDTKCGIK